MESLTFWKLGLLHWTVSQAVNTMEKFLKKIKDTNSVNPWMTRKWNSLIANMEKGLVVQVEDQAIHSIPVRQSLI